MDALKSGTVDDLRQGLALAAFQHTAEYDTAISKWMKVRTMLKVKGDN